MVSGPEWSAASPLTKSPKSKLLFTGRERVPGPVWSAVSLDKNAKSNVQKKQVTGG